MLLPVGFSNTFENIITILPGFVYITYNKSAWSNNQFAFFLRHSWISDNRQWINIHFYFLNSRSCSFICLRYYKSNWHSAKMNMLIGEQRLIGNDTTNLIDASNVFISEDLNYARDSHCIFHVQVRDNTMCHWGTKSSTEQSALQ